MRLPRFVHKVYALIFGYFYLPCEVCGTYFGGHEWKTENAILISQTRGEKHYRGVCSAACAAKFKNK